MIQEIQSQWNEMPEKDITLICSKYKISRPTARRYIQMPAEEIQGMDRPRKSKHSAGQKKGTFHENAGGLLSGRCYCNKKG